MNSQRALHTLPSWAKVAFVSISEETEQNSAKNIPETKIELKFADIVMVQIMEIDPQGRQELAKHTK